MYDSVRKLYLEVGQIFIEHIFSRFTAQIHSVSSISSKLVFREKVSKLSELKALLKNVTTITHTHFSEEASQADVNEKFLQEIEFAIEKEYEELVETLMRSNGASDE